MVQKAAPGWYPTETNPGWVRWFDGTQWADAYWQVSTVPTPYRPTWERFDVSIPGIPSFDIVGEGWREAEILAAVGKSNLAVDVEFEYFASADLVPEPDNPFDSDAVSVRLNGYVVGYLSSGDAKDYFHILSRFVANKIVPTVNARVWGVTRFVRSRNRNELKSAIRVSLPAPSELLAANVAPENHFLIPRGRTIQVSGEEEHFEQLRPYIGKLASVDILCTLHPIETNTRSGKSVLEVRLDGARVGQLSPVTSASLSPFVAEASGHGRIAAVWARLSGSHLAAELTLRAAKAEEIPPTWPSDGDVHPVLDRSLAIAPAAFSAPVEIVPPPLPKGLHGGIWAAALILVLLLLAIPYVGFLLGVGVIVGCVFWNSAERKKPPKGARSSPR